MKPNNTVAGIGIYVLLAGFIVYGIVSWLWNL